MYDTSMLRTKVYSVDPLSYIHVCIIKHKVLNLHMNVRYCTLMYAKLILMFDIEHYSFSDACATPSFSRGLGPYVQVAYTRDKSGSGNS